MMKYKHLGTSMVYCYCVLVVVVAEKPKTRWGYGRLPLNGLMK